MRIRQLTVLIPVAVVASLLVLVAATGCSVTSGGDAGDSTNGDTGTGDSTNGDTVATATAADSSGNDYRRQQVNFYRGVSEPRCDALTEMARESERLLDTNINTVSLLPPVLISERAGGWPRVILDGAAASVDQSIEDFHTGGLAVHLAPTTASPGYSARIEPSDMTLEHLSEDVLKWAETAEANQVELFSPLSQYNLALGTATADEWSTSILPEIRAVYAGKLAAKVVPDIDGPPAAGQSHDFEGLDYRGYDYLMLDLFPTGEQFDEDAYRQYVAELLDRAVSVAARDGLKGVLVGEFGGWRVPMGVDETKGPTLGNEGQAVAAAVVLDEVERVGAFGAFFQGWTTPGRGAHNFPVEDTLKEYYGSSMVIAPAGSTD